MKEKAILITCYSILLIVGGVIGFLTANSLASLFSSGIIAIILLITAFFIAQRKKGAYETAIVITALVSVFFIYRYFLTYKFAPAGIMAIISCALLAYLLTGWNKKEV